jgi:conjugal transfer pilus assembly protein TrbC
VWAIERARLALAALTLPFSALAQVPRDPLPGPPPAAHAPRIEALPRPVTQGSLDLEAITRGFADRPGPMSRAAGEAQLLVFISLSMPEPALKRLVDQAARAAARLVLRGLAEESLVRTAARVQALIGQQRVSLQIDPREFDRYAVTQAPTFVLARAEPSGACPAGQCASGAHVSVSGDVSLDYALRHIRDRAPAFHDEAARRLAMLNR